MKNNELQLNGMYEKKLEIGLKPAGSTSAVLTPLLKLKSQLSPTTSHNIVMYLFPMMA